MPDRPDATRFILVGTSHPGNVGAAARALKVMGFRDLVLVAPRHAEVLRHPEALAFASGAADVLAGARVVESLAQALDGVQFACATAMTPRDFGPPTSDARSLCERAAREPAVVGFVFGSERVGLANDDVYRCHACLSIPTAVDYGSLNLAQAVQVVAYEWRMARGAAAVTPRTAATPAADAQAVADLLEHWRDALVDVGFLDPAAPRKLMPRLNQLINRAQPTVEEVNILRGIARAMQQPRRR